MLGRISAVALSIGLLAGALCDLQAVQKEQIHVLPFLFSGEVNSSVSPF
jgi:hypothetical protein